MAMIKSRFHISRFQWSYFLLLHVVSHETPKQSRRSRSHLDLTAAIKSQFCISQFQWSYFLPLKVASRESLKWSQQSRSHLDLMATIKSGVVNGIQRSEMLLLLSSLLCSAYYDIAIEDLPTILCTISSELIRISNLLCNVFS
jgi:hypothetical protein